MIRVFREKVRDRREGREGKGEGRESRRRVME